MQHLHQVFFSVVITHLGHTNLIICFSDWVEKKRDPVGRQKKKKKKGEYH